MFLFYKHVLKEQSTMTIRRPETILRHTDSDQPSLITCLLNETVSGIFFDNLNHHRRYNSLYENEINANIMF